jgi:flagellar export protein FliJ
MEMKALKKVYKLRGQLKDRLELEASAARNILHGEQCRLRDMEEALLVSVGELGERQAKGDLSAGEYELHVRICFEMGGEIGKQKKVVDQRALEFMEKQASLLEANKEKKTLKVLTDKLKKESRIMKSRLEQRNIDDLSLRSKQVQDA